MGKKRSSSEESGKKHKKRARKPRPAQDWLNTTEVHVTSYPKDGTPWFVPKIVLPRRRRDKRD